LKKKGHFFRLIYESGKLCRIALFKKTFLQNRICAKIYGTSNDYGTRYEQTRTIVTVSAACAASLLVLGACAFIIVKRRKKKLS
jgi:hypothetical protein